MIAYMIACMLHFSISSNPNVRNSLIELLEGCQTLQPIGKIIDILHKEGMYESLPLQWPVKGKYRISSHYGYRNHPLSGTKKFHSGVDIAVELATPVYAAGSGSVIYAGRKGGYGRCIIIQHKFGFTTVYGHLSAYYTTVGRERRTWNDFSGLLPCVEQTQYRSAKPDSRQSDVQGRKEGRHSPQRG